MCKINNSVVVILERYYKVSGTIKSIYSWFSIIKFIRLSRKLLVERVLFWSSVCSQIECWSERLVFKINRLSVYGYSSLGKLNKIFESAAKFANLESLVIYAETQCFLGSRFLALNSLPVSLVQVKLGIPEFIIHDWSSKDCFQSSNLSLVLLMLLLKFLDNYLSSFELGYQWLYLVSS